jgi:hypothetical protein
MIGIVAVWANINKNFLSHEESDARLDYIK